MSSMRLFCLSDYGENFGLEQEFLTKKQRPVQIKPAWQDKGIEPPELDSDDVSKFMQAAG